MVTLFLVIIAVLPVYYFMALPLYQRRTAFREGFYLLKIEHFGTVVKTTGARTPSCSKRL